MRVIAGTARGTKLSALPGEDITRPTVDRVKEAMFSSLQFLLPGARVLDLFAGSGQLGIEALSRGAQVCTFVDENAAAIRVVTANCRAAGLEEKSRIVSQGAAAFLANTPQEYDVILLDPPYRRGILENILPAVAQATAAGGTVLCESEKGLKLPEEVGGLKQKKQHKYGTVLVTRYVKEQADEY